MPLVSAALSLPDGTKVAVADALEAALKAGQLDRSWALAQLAELRDIDGVRAMIDVLERARDGDRARAVVEAERMGGEWAPRLRSALRAQE